jgi:DNA-binding NtrC family response regulator
MVIMITGHASLESGIAAMKEGAFDYITKPIKIDEVRLILQKALEKRNLLIENIQLRQQLKGKYRFENLVGTSKAMQEVFSLMEKVVNSDTTVLIQGESGTGKELVAKAIHYNGPRKDKPFVAINCAAIPHELLESELLTRERSFTGAIVNTGSPNWPTPARYCRW